MEVPMSGGHISRALIDKRKKHGFLPKDSAEAQAFAARSRTETDAMISNGRISYRLLGDELHEISVDDALAGTRWALHASGADRVAWRPNKSAIYALLEQKFGATFGYKWEPENAVIAGRYSKASPVERQFVSWPKGQPKIGGSNVTLYDMLLLPLDAFDNYKQNIKRSAKDESQTDAEMRDVFARAAATGIGYKGLSGISWRACLAPFELPAYFLAELELLARAVFHFSDAVDALYATHKSLQQLLNHKRPDRIAPLMKRGKVSIIRPDVVISFDPEQPTKLRPVITEIESCPAGQGMTHAMQAGYKLSLDMVDEFVAMLAGRPFIVLSTSEWAEYVFDQATFCKALRDRGVDARVLFDSTLEKIHDHAMANWVAPAGLPEHLQSAWSRDFLGRLDKLGFLEFVSGVEVVDLPETVGDAVVFRFGYFDNFAPATIARMEQWQDAGAEISNPLQFPLESKSLMAAVKLPSVRAWIATNCGDEELAVLDRCLADTVVVGTEFGDLESLRNYRAHLVTKFAAWDGNNESWGARSLVVGHSVSGVEWNRSLGELNALPHPVVAQHLIASTLHSAAFIDAAGVHGTVTNARTRLTPFFLRGNDGVVRHGGSMITLREGTMRIHGASDAVEGPVVYK
ncbi:MAG: hypothetical protein NT003_03880 [Candidatus Magasanikbacteria bacterium]|nr:hypothetical protein [Candidatus Magasanikbacteria bacterium]